MDHPSTLSELRVENQVAWLKIKRPELRNAFDDLLVAELTQHLRYTAKQEELRALVLLSEGQHFSAGADMNWMKRMTEVSSSDNQMDALRLAALMDALDNQPMPVLARVQGAAFGGAIGLISCCDIVIAASHARFSLSEAKLGLAPATIAPYVMAAIGKRRCRQLFLSAEIFSAEDAFRYGLVHKVVSEDQLDNAVNQYLSLVLQTGPSASRACKALLRNIDPDGDKSHYHGQTSNLIARLRVSEEGQAGLQAFLEKQSPPWVKPA